MTRPWAVAAVVWLGCSGSIAPAVDDAPAGGSGGSAAAHASAGGSGGAPPSGCEGAAYTPSPIRRLTRDEYDNTIRDLMGEASAPARQFPADEEVGGRIRAHAVGPLVGSAEL